MRVLQRLGATGLAQESLQYDRILRIDRWQDFEGNFMPGCFVNGSIDRAHSARSQWLYNPVAAEAKLGGLRSELLALSH
jgi:hypothetical protein